MKMRTLSQIQPLDGATARVRAQAHAQIYTDKNSCKIRSKIMLEPVLQTGRSKIKFWYSVNKSHNAQEHTFLSTENKTTNGHITFTVFPNKYSTLLKYTNHSTTLTELL